MTEKTFMCELFLDKNLQTEIKVNVDRSAHYFMYVFSSKENINRDILQKVLTKFACKK